MRGLPDIVYLLVLIFAPIIANAFQSWLAENRRQSATKAGHKQIAATVIEEMIAASTSDPRIRAAVVASTTPPGGSRRCPSCQGLINGNETERSR